MQNIDDNPNALKLIKKGLLPRYLLNQWAEAHGAFTLKTSIILSAILVIVLSTAAILLMTKGAPLVEAQAIAQGVSHRVINILIAGWILIVVAAAISIDTWLNPMKKWRGFNQSFGTLLRNVQPRWTAEAFPSDPAAFKRQIRQSILSLRRSMGKEWSTKDEIALQDIYLAAAQFAAINDPEGNRVSLIEVFDDSMPTEWRA